MAAGRSAGFAGLVAILVIAAVAASASGVAAGMLAFGHPGQTPGQGSTEHWGLPAGPYSVNFTETGLPAGAFWTVSLHLVGGPGHGTHPRWAGGYSGGRRSASNGSTGASVGFAVGNGTYAYSVFAPGNASTQYSAAPSVGHVTVNGTSVSVAVTFTPVSLFPVSFSESGLPAGTFWSVLVVGAAPGHGPGPWGHGGFVGNGSTGSTVNFTLPDGTFGFAVRAAWAAGTLYLATPSFGNVTVDGGAASVSVQFAPLPLYGVSFVETGLPNGTVWSVALSSGGWAGPGWNGSATDSVNFTAANGTYPFFVPPVWTAGGEYVASPSSGPVTVDGAAVTVDVTFAPAASGP